MKFIKSLNNNIAMVLDDNGKESIAVGRGISFNKHKNDIIDINNVEKVFILKDKTYQNKLESIIAQIPMEYVLVSEDIISMLKEHLEHLSDMIYITLVDHISEAIEREKNKDIYDNPLLSDIQCFYRKEYQLAKKANEIINKHFGFYLSDNELGFITLHIVNANSSGDLSETVQMTRSTSDIIHIIETVYSKKFDRTTLRYDRLVRHLMFLIQRITHDQQEKFVFSSYMNHDQASEDAISRIDSYIYGKYGKHMNHNEKNYLKYHILIIIQI